MKKKWLQIIYIVIVGVIVLLPLVGMAFKKEDDSASENRRLAELPALISEEGLNIYFLPQLGAYYEDHFAFREEAVAADSGIMAGVFGVSPVDTIIKGTGDWLYYKDSLHDFRNDAVISEREAFALAHNIALIQKTLEGQGISFLFTVAPNKNSLYGGNMPYYYSVKAQEEGNIELVSGYLNEMGVNYADLFEAFREVDGVLYRTQDSHWNGKGALLAYNCVLDQMQVDHDRHDRAVEKRVKTETGDLARSLYGKYADTEWDTIEDIAVKHTITNGADDWDALLIETESVNKAGTLLMFRDSFGITLSPLVADEFGKAAFSRATIYMLDSYVDTYKPDHVIFEIVERNLTNYVQFDPESQQTSGPPIMHAPETKIGETGTFEGHAFAVLYGSTVQSSVGMIYGGITSGIIDTNAEIYLTVTSEDNSKTYEAFLISDLSGNENGFLAYLPWEELDRKDLQIEVIIKQGEEYLAVETEVIK